MNISKTLIQKIRGLQTSKKVLVMGSAVIDVILQLDKLPVTGQDIMAEHKKTIVGGCAYNVTNILKQLNFKHDLIVPVGRGANADLIRKQLKDDNHDIVLEEDTQDNGWNLSIVEKGGERTFITIPGLELNWKSAWAEQIDLSPYDFICLSGYELEGSSGQVVLKTLESKAESCRIVLDPGPRVGYIGQEVWDKMFGRGTILHVNQGELNQLTGEQDVMNGARKAFQMTNQPVIVTLGKDGTLYYTAEGSEVLRVKK
ncbi:PfkB family carbohydrate kinase [Paenibacillus larvae]|uniref:Carbohydrate kinase PfkB domain-containing protein n=3 Tax=Paenibacillus larvae TaxID=1464 RepID=V9W9T9_9BACL|nr:PfkB family carbohydrate kinase [Paenibacillus larvae]AHD06943.1 hypothetical protein ERIC2_c31930 [Paenibacillus larvae subsp. larvae DSM 25430]AVG13505.1 ribokinase [Paenibacillus larvae subsp. larvae DSM 25430]QHZ50537.1 ribokinase [Paenibacillus larvae subsp. larvae]